MIVTTVVLTNAAQAKCFHSQCRSRMCAVTHQILNLNCVLSQMAINGTCEATPTRPQNSYPISARGLEGFNSKEACSAKKRALQRRVLCKGECSAERRVLCNPRLLPPHRRPGPGGRDGEPPGLLRGRAVLCHGWAELRLPALRSSQQPRAGRGGLQPRAARQLDHLDFNAISPATMTLPMTVALPEENAARLSWLHKCLSGLNWESDSKGYLLLVDYDSPPEVHNHLDWARA